MHETDEDVAKLQEALDESHANAGDHLRSIFTPESRSSAEDLVKALTGIFLINLATVTAGCEPLVAPVDGLFYRGRLWFGLPPKSQRARHLRERPAVSATKMEGQFPDGHCLIVHGTAQRVTARHPLHAEYTRYALGLYGLPIPDDLDDAAKPPTPEQDFTGFIQPRRIYAHGFV